MARRVKPTRNVRRVGRLQQRHDAEVRAYGAFFDVADRRAELQIALDRLDEDEAAAVASLAALLDAATVAALVGWSATKVRAAAKMTDANSVAGGDEGIHTAAQVAG